MVGFSDTAVSTAVLAASFHCFDAGIVREFIDNQMSETNPV